MKFYYIYLIYFLLLSLSPSCSKKSTRGSAIQRPKTDIKNDKKLDDVVLSDRNPEEKIIKENFKFNFSKKKYMTDVLREAVATKKLIFLDISAHWCTPCQMMKRDVYSDDQASAFFNTNFVSHLVDVEADEGPDIKVIYEVTKYPTLLILDEKGNVMGRYEGGLSSSGLIKFARNSCLGKCN